MKTIFKSILAAALFVGVGTTASAQTPALGVAGEVGARVRILKQIIVAENDSILFGTVAAGNGQTFLDPRGVANSNVGIANAVGRLVITASAEENIRIDFDSAVVMQRTVPGATDSMITYVPVISVIHKDTAASAAARTASVLLSNATISNVSTEVTGTGGNGEGPTALFTTDPATEATTFFIGGYLYVLNTRTAIPSSHSTGTYIGEMNFNIFYAL